MPQRLPFYPTAPAFNYGIQLDGVQYRLRFTYNDERESWYFDLRDADGNDLLVGQRVVPYQSMTRGVIVDGPPGLLTTYGSNPYARDELTLIYVPEAELGQVPTPATAPTGRVILIDE